MMFVGRTGLDLAYVLQELLYLKVQGAAALPAIAYRRKARTPNR